MSPRSQEFLDEARDRLEVARLALANGFAPAALSAGYDAMLVAAERFVDAVATPFGAE